MNESYIPVVEQQHISLIHRIVIALFGTPEIYADEHGRIIECLRYQGELYA